MISSKFNFKFNKIHNLNNLLNTKNKLLVRRIYEIMTYCINFVNKKVYKFLLALNLYLIQSIKNNKNKITS